MTRRKIRLIESTAHTEGTPIRAAKVYRDAEFDEYVVQFYRAGVKQDGASYHTSDKEDALRTAETFVAPPVESFMAPTVQETVDNLLVVIDSQAYTSRFALADDASYFLKNRGTLDYLTTKRELIERAIVRHFVRSVLAMPEGYRLRLHDGVEWATPKTRDEMSVMAELKATDCEYLYVYAAEGERKIGRIDLVYGNDGHDVIADNTASDEFAAIISATDKYAEAIAASSYR